jgi:hypothetical protein
MYIFVKLFVKLDFYIAQVKENNQCELLARGPHNLNATQTQVCKRHLIVQCQVTLADYNVDVQKLALRTESVV